MRLTPIDINEIPRKDLKATKLFEIMTEFANSEYTAVRVDDHNYKSVMTAAQNFNRSAKHFGLLGIKAISRSGQLFLIKEI